VAANPAATAPAHAQAGPTDPAELGSFIDEVMTSAMDTNPFPGAVASVVKDGQLFFQKGYGYADPEKQTPVDPTSTIFRIGSTTKLFTWTAVMQLAEQGKLDLDADINTYLDFSIPNTFPQPITLKNLLTHTPGFEEQKDGHFKTRAEDVTSLGQYLKMHIPARVFPPGKIGAYSNYGAALSGYIVERVSGMAFATYVEKNIFTPLGMTHSTLRQPLPASLAPDLSGGYYYTQGEYAKVGFEYAVDYPAGALSSTAADISKFMLAHLQDGRWGDARILSEQTARQMHSQLFTHDPRIPGMAYGFFESSISGHRIISDGGDTLVFHSSLWLIPDQDTGIFVTTNGAGGATIATLLIYQYVEHYYPAAAASSAPAPSADFASRMTPYLGTYYPARGNFTTFEKLMEGMPPLTVSLDATGHLLISQQGATLPLVAVAPGLLRDPNDADTQIVLHTDEAGQAYLLSSDPWAYIKVPWYSTTEFRDLLVQIALLLSLATLIVWGSAFIARVRQREKGEPLPFLSHLARWVGALFGPVLIVIFVGLDFLLKTRDTVFGYPVVLIDKPLVFYILMALPYVLAGLGVLMVVFTVLAWTRRYWGWVGRLHYTVLTLSGLSVLWGMWYWNLLL
jgi:CubicO group peptidase (beta-lactamase class C family)